MKTALDLVMAAKARIQEVKLEDAEQAIREADVLLDVREADEWEAGHAPAATWIPLGEIQARVGEIPSGAPIVAICRSGARSRAVAEALLGAGYDVVNVGGGMREWAAEDYEVVASDGLPGQVI